MSASGSGTVGLLGYVRRFALDVVFFSVATWGIVLPCVVFVHLGGSLHSATSIIASTLFFGLAALGALFVRWSRRELAILLLAFFLARIAITLAIAPDPWHDAGVLWANSGQIHIDQISKINIYQCYGLFFYYPIQLIFGSSYQIVPFVNSTFILIVSGIISTVYSRSVRLEVLAATLTLVNLAPVVFLAAGIASYDLTGALALLVFALCAMQLVDRVVRRPSDPGSFLDWSMAGWGLATAGAGIVLIYARLPSIAPVLVLALLFALRIGIDLSDRTPLHSPAQRARPWRAIVTILVCFAALSAVWLAVQGVSPVCATKDGNTSGGLFRLSFEQPYTEGIYRFRFGQVHPTLGGLDNSMLINLWQRLLTSALKDNFWSYFKSYVSKSQILVSPGDLSIYFYSPQNPAANAIQRLLSYLQAVQAGYSLVVFVVWIGGVVTVRSFFKQAELPAKQRFLLLGLPFVAALFIGMVVVGGEVAARYYLPVFFLCAPLALVSLSILNNSARAWRRQRHLTLYQRLDWLGQVSLATGREAVWIFLIIALPVLAVAAGSFALGASRSNTFLDVHSLFESAPNLQRANEVAVDGIPITDPEKTKPPKPFGPYAILLPVSLSTNWLAGEICGLRPGDTSMSMIAGSVLGDRAAPGYACTLTVDGSSKDCAAAPRRVVVRNLHPDERLCVPVSLQRSTGIGTAFFLGFVSRSRGSK